MIECSFEPQTSLQRKRRKPVLQLTVLNGFLSCRFLVYAGIDFCPKHRHVFTMDMEMFKLMTGITFSSLTKSWVHIIAKMAPLTPFSITQQLCSTKRKIFFFLFISGKKGNLYILNTDTKICKTSNFIYLAFMNGFCKAKPGSRFCRLLKCPVMKLWLLPHCC